MEQPAAPDPQSQPDPPSQSQEPSPSSSNGGDGHDLLPRVVVDEARREAAAARMRVRELEEQQRAAERRAQEVEDREKSELERAQARAERLERELSKVRQSETRHEVAADKRLPPELLDVPPAGDRPALEAYADRLVRYIGQQNELAVEQSRQPRRVTTPVERGTPVAEAADMNDFIRQGFRR